MAVTVESLGLRPLNDERFRGLFNEVDTNNDGRISYKELKQYINMTNGTNVPRTIRKQIFKEADRDADGTIDYNEFVAMFTNPDNATLFNRASKRAYVYANLIVPKGKQRRHIITPMARSAAVGDGGGGGGDGVDGIYEDEYSCMPPPLGMLTVTLAIIAVYCVDVSLGYDSTQARGPTAQALIYDPRQREQVWRFISYMFVHIGHMHMIVNILVQILLGIPLEMIHGWWRVPLVYFCGVIFGSLATSVTDPCVKLAGASGGVYSLITAHVAAIIMNWKEMSYPLVQMFVFVIIIGVDVGTAIYNRYTLDLNDNIGYAAHLAGAVAGLFIGVIALKNLEVETHEKVIRYAAVVVLVLMLGAAVVWNVAYTEYFACML